MTRTEYATIHIKVLNVCISVRKPKLLVIFVSNQTVYFQYYSF